MGKRLIFYSKNSISADKTSSCLRSLCLRCDENGIIFTTFYTRPDTKCQLNVCKCALFLIQLFLLLDGRIQKAPTVTKISPSKHSDTWRHLTISLKGKSKKWMIAFTLKEPHHRFTILLIYNRETMLSVEAMRWITWPNIRLNDYLTVPGIGWYIKTNLMLHGTLHTVSRHLDIAMKMKTGNRIFPPYLSLSIVTQLFRDEELLWKVPSRAVCFFIKKELLLEKY